eukprot:TRINITY_DN672_c0_g1_i4.p1 TRINITY_DN672_c0_g1~~TRINITY_DN672_c0_g1_i4.p1  ORF type:complete len:1020 (+),score=255.13 TRINITY_DN672_c0_g1_i4:97-3060(+)
MAGLQEDEWPRKDSVDGVPVPQVECLAANAYADEAVEAGPVVLAYCRALKQYRWVWACLIVAAIGTAAPFAGKFPGACTTAFNPPKDSAAHKDREVLAEHFPNMSQSSDIVLYAEHSDQAAPVLSEELAEFSRRLHAVAPKWPKGLELQKHGAPPVLISLTGYYSMLDTAGEAAAASFLSNSPPNVSTFFDFRVSAPMTSEVATHYCDWIKGQISELKKATGCGKYQFTLLGAPAFIHVILDASTSDLERMDMIVLPIAVFILAWIVRSLRLMLMPLISLGFSAAVSFAVMYGVALVKNVFSGASALMMSILIAMSIDYGLFLLTRYREELERGVGTEKAVERMLVSAGHTIIVSGLTLAVCFFGLVFLQNDFMVSVGLGCGIVLLCVLAFNLFITPLLLLNFPAFFERCLQPGPFCPPRPWCFSAEGRAQVAQICTCSGGAAVGAEAADEEAGARDHDALIARDLHGTSAWHLDKQSLWYRFGDMAVRFPINLVLIVVVIGAVFYCCLYSTTYKVTNNNMLYLPRHSGVADAYARMGETFGYGQVWSYQLLLVPQGENATYNPHSKSTVWERTQGLLTALEQRVPSTGAGNIAGVLYAGVRQSNGKMQSTNVSKQLVAECLDCCSGEACANVSTTCSTTLGSVLKSVCDNCTKAPGACDALICNMTKGQPALHHKYCGGTQAEKDLFHKLCPPDQPADPEELIRSTCKGTMVAWEQFVNKPQDTTWARFTPPFAPMGVDGKDWLLDARGIAATFPAEFGIRLYIVGQACDGVDAMDALYDEFPTMIGVTCAVVFVFVAIAFRSIFIPLRSVVTIALTIFFVQGLAALVYQHGAWDWTHFEGFKSTDAVIYINPLLSFSIIVGVGLDYDIFLITRIVEYRRVFARQFPDRDPSENTMEAIKTGLTKTAGIITAAGVIMAIAFSGLLLSREPEMNQLAFYMVFAVLFDTFIVRPILVPATMSLLYEWNWWPCTFRRGPCDRNRDPLAE